MKIKISVIKFDEIGGKRTNYKSFAFEMDPEEMAQYKTEATVRKKIEEYIVKSGVFKRDDVKRLKYSMKDFLEAWREEVKKVEEHPETESTYDLERFVDAQVIEYETAIEELKDGCKRSHWIWFIFPQQKGLGHSYNSYYYGLDGIDEAKAYLAHPVLGSRLRECCQALLGHKGKRDIIDIMGSDIDVLKLETSMNLFNHVSPNDVFKKVLKAFF